MNKKQRREYFSYRAAAIVSQARSISPMIFASFKGFAEIPCIDLGFNNDKPVPFAFSFTDPYACCQRVIYSAYPNAVLCIFMRSLVPCISNSDMGSGFYLPQLYEIIVCLKRKNMRRRYYQKRSF